MEEIKFPSTATLIRSPSVIVKEAEAEVNPAAEPDKKTVSAPSPPTLSSAAAKVKVAEPEREPPGMVTVNFPLVKPVVEKSFASAVAAPSVETVTVTSVSVSNVAEPDGKEAVTCTVREAPSATLVCTAGVEVSVSTARERAAGRESLSESMVTAVPVIAKPERSAEPDRVMVSGVTSTTWSSTMVKVNVPDAARPPAGMVNGNRLLARPVVKSAASALPAVASPAMVTVTTVSDSKVLDPSGSRTATVAVAAASPSPMAVCNPVVPPSKSTVRLAPVGAASLSSICKEAPVILTPAVVATPETAMVSAPSA